MKKLIYFSLALVLSCSVLACLSKDNAEQSSTNAALNNNSNLTDDLVPDQQTAIKIAEAIWLPIYGEKVLSEKPYAAELKNGVWFVNGTLKEEKGGVAYIEINKKDCKILNVYHTK
jgi:hypothetical protein